MSKIDLWSGVELKLQHAQFFYGKMSSSLNPPERTGWNVALESTGAILDTGWQRSLYPYLDAFLAMTRSVPEIINCCFGKDTAPNMASWFCDLDVDEQKRREEFSAQFRMTFAAGASATSLFSNWVLTTLIAALM
jgi:hypothetical protein